MESVKKLNDKHYTYKDYMKWPEGERGEIINGTAYAMTPSPSVIHQKISLELSRQFANYLIGKPCKIFTAPLDVFMPKAEDIIENTDVIVQPDIIIVCDKTKIISKGIKGAPDLVVEIISPHSGSRDKVEKLNLYERSGVREYWIIDPEDCTVMVFKLGSDSRFGRPDTYDGEDEVNVGIFKDLSLDLRTIFTD